MRFLHVIFLVVFFLGCTRDSNFGPFEKVKKLLPLPGDYVVLNLDEDVLLQGTGKMSERYTLYTVNLPELKVDSLVIPFEEIGALYSATYCDGHIILCCNECVVGCLLKGDLSWEKEVGADVLFFLKSGDNCLGGSMREVSFFDTNFVRTGSLELFDNFPYGIGEAIPPQVVFNDSLIFFLRFYKLCYKVLCAQSL
ncbi:MAG TPA: hypothetical protein PKU94_08085 [Candidatus Hydrothermia bacterium]|nr:hypothetical protein [Candidatus Hydrothermia bacterium]